MELAQIKNEKHRAIIRDINEGLDKNTIVKRHGISEPTYYRTKRIYGKALVESQGVEITDKMVGSYSSRLINKAKYSTLRIADALMSKPLSGASLSQLTTSMVNINAMLRLEQGKSTENIAHNVVHNLNPEQLTLIKESIMNLKKSMLKE